MFVDRFDDHLDSVFVPLETLRLLANLFRYAVNITPIEVSPPRMCILDSRHRAEGIADILPASCLELVHRQPLRVRVTLKLGQLHLQLADFRLQLVSLVTYRLDITAQDNRRWITTKHVLFNKFAIEHSNPASELALSEIRTPDYASIV